MKKIIILILFIFPVVSLSSAIYQMDDLKELAKSQSWVELIEHLNDIPPSKRDKDWTEMANVALSSRFQALVSAGNTQHTIEFLEKTFPKYPSLIKNQAFMKLRGEFGIRYYEPCLSYNDDACHKELLGFVALDPNPLYSFTVAKLVRLRMSDNKAIEYFELALSKQALKNVCDDKDLRLSLQSALQTKPGSDYAKSSKKVAFGQCFESLKDSITTVVKDNDNAKHNACEQLLARNAVKGITKKKCTRFVEK